MEGGGAAPGRGAGRGLLPPWKGMALAQVLALLNGVTAGLFTAMADVGISSPTIPEFVNYGLLCFSFGAMTLAGGSGALTAFRQNFKRDWPKFLALAMVDVEANFCIITAFRYGTITSVTLIDCTSVFFVMGITALLFRARYNAKHVGGAAICILGVSVLVFSDASHSETGSQGRLVGDLLAVASAILYAVSNTLLEHMLTKYKRRETMFAMGFFGMCVVSVQLGVVGRREFEASTWSPKGVLLCLAGGLVLFALYALVPEVIRLSGAVGLNLAFVVTNVWSALARLVFFQGFASATALAGFVVAFVLTFAGILVYTVGGDPRSPPPSGAWAKGGYAVLEGGGRRDSGGGGPGREGETDGGGGRPRVASAEEAVQLDMELDAQNSEGDGRRAARQIITDDGRGCSATT